MTTFRDDAHAVIIGINTYKDDRIPNLRYARADAESMADVLTDPSYGRFRKDRVTVLLDEQATERAIRSAVGTLLPRQSEDEHTVCVYYAGHGAPLVDPRSKAADGLEKYLIPYDADATDLRASAISMDTFQQWFDWIHAKQVVFFLDCCYSGAGGRSFDVPGFQRRAAVVTEEFLDELGKGEGRFIVTACSANEVSLEREEIAHGVFTHHLVQGLKGAADTDGDGQVTLNELYDYLSKSVKREAQRMGGAMSPVCRGSARGSVYLTQYMTDEQRRAREAATEGAAALRAGDIKGAEAGFRRALELDPQFADARDQHASVRAQLDRLEGEERSRREARQSVLQRREAKLLSYANAGQLTKKQWAEAVDLLHHQTGDLTPDDRDKLEFVEQLADGEIKPSAYVRAIESWARVKPRTSALDLSAVPVAPPPVPAAPPPERAAAPPVRAAPPPAAPRPRAPVTPVVEMPLVREAAAAAAPGVGRKPRTMHAASVAIATGLLVGVHLASTTSPFDGKELIPATGTALGVFEAVHTALRKPPHRWVLRGMIALGILASCAFVLLLVNSEFVLYADSYLQRWALTSALVIAVMSMVGTRPRMPRVPRTYLAIAAGIPAALLSHALIGSALGDSVSLGHALLDGVAFAALIGMLYDLLESRDVHAGHILGTLAVIGVLLSGG